MEPSLPAVIEQPETTQGELNLIKLETTFPKEQFRRAVLPEGTVAFFQSQTFLHNYNWRYVETNTIGAKQVFRPGETESW